MSLRARLDRLDERERRLLGILVVVAGLFVILLIPLGLTAMLGSKRAEIESRHEALAAISNNAETVAKVQAQREVIEARYAKRTPPLASFLASLASASGVDISETHDRDTVPHGKKYEERSSKIELRRVGMLGLSRFIERIEQSGHPVRVTKLNIRKRGTEPDSFDVEMVVSAFDRKAPSKKNDEDAK